MGNPRDVICDASHNFSRRYQKHVLIECAQEYEIRAREEPKTVDTSNDGQRPFNSKPSVLQKTFRGRTYLVGQSMGTEISTKPEGNAEAGQSGAHDVPAKTIGSCDTNAPVFSGRQHFQDQDTYTGNCVSGGNASVACSASAITHLQESCKGEHAY